MSQQETLRKEPLEFDYAKNMLLESNVIDIVNFFDVYEFPASVFKDQEIINHIKALLEETKEMISDCKKHNMQIDQDTKNFIALAREKFGLE